jgi:hypothetical protein
MDKREAGMETIYDYNSGNFYHFDHSTGEALKCNVKGDPIPTFIVNVSGNADTSERRRRGHQPQVPVLENAPELPQILRLPAKYCGYASCPRPGIHITAGASNAYKLPQYLQPQQLRLGRISTRAAKKEVKGDGWKSETPSFMATLGSQFDDAMKMSSFLPESELIRSNTDLLAVTARNRQVVLDEKGTLDIAIEKLRAQRTKTAGRFGCRGPPYNTKERKDLEEAQDRLVNPTKWRKQDDKLALDKQKVKQRQRDRYLQFFVDREEQEEKMKRQELEMTKQSEEQLG